ncbi:hypothetical protein LINPERPRIM_LOCUS22084 [Linum perenne]
MVSDTAKDLKFVDIPESAQTGGILKLPSSVWEKGFETLKATLVAQFVGTPPLLRVIAVVANRLWGYEGSMTISKYLDTC